MKVTELSRDELIELKQRYLMEQREEAHEEEPSYGELAIVDELISDDEIFAEFDYIDFEKDDFLKGGVSVKVISFINQKGGVGKSTSCLNIGAALSLCGFKVLLVDIDPQGNLSQSAGFDEIGDDEPTVYEVLKGGNINAAIRSHAGRYDVLPADIRLSAGEIELASSKRRNDLLRAALGKLTTSYDFVLVDCPPSLSVFTLMALSAADEVIIPVQAQYLPLKGVSQIVDTVALVKSRFNDKLDIGGVVLTFYDGRRNLDADVLEALKGYFGKKVYKTTISVNTKLAEAPSYGKDIFEYSPTSKGAKQYRELAKEVSKGMKPQKRKRGN